ncbi:MAG: Crp/Fnr family transcriptional regulator [Wenzhouxiangellaceae bacterium]
MDSCIVGQFQRLANISDKEISLLRTLEENAESYQPDVIIQHEDQPSKHFYTIRKGWAYSSRILADGDRQILDIFLPGHIMGLREIGFNKSTYRFVTLTQAEICPFPKARLTEIFNESPRLTDLFFLVIAREQSILAERIINLGRRSAAQKLAHFVIETKVRLGNTIDEFDLMLSQELLGDTLGLSSVHISRTFKFLRDRGLIERDGNRVKIVDLEALMEFADFNPCYLEQDVQWARQG